MDLKSTVRKWDDERSMELNLEAIELSTPPLDPAQSYRTVWERIRILQHCGLDQYAAPIPASLEHRLPTWLGQFEEQEQKIAIIAASRILFITWPQLRSLQRYLYERKIKRLLLDEIIAEQGLTPYRYDLADAYLLPKLDACLFSPLSDSAHLNSFMHANALDLHRPASRRLIGPTVQMLVQPAKLACKDPTTAKIAAEYRDAFARNELDGKIYLFVLEDFAGSGQTAASDLARLVSEYPQFRKIVFCPYVCTEQAKRAIAEASKRLSSRDGERIEVLTGLELPDGARVFHPNCYLWEEYDLPLPAELAQEQLRRVCEKYYVSHHHLENAPYLDTAEPERVTCGGYRDGQLLVLFYSNCPNNTLPLIWSMAPGMPEPWKPLFQRFPRY